VGKTPKSATFRSSRRVKLALVPVVGLAVVAFATQAHAGTAGVISLDPTATVNEETSSATETAAALDSVGVTSPTTTPSTPTEPTGDGSVAGAATAIETPVTAAPDGLEMPANKAVALEADMGIAATDPIQNSVQVPPVMDVVATPTAAISPTQADPPVAEALTTDQSVPEPVASHATRQYHPSSKQYQHRRTADDHGTRVRRRPLRSVAASVVRVRGSRVLQHPSNLVQIMSRSCAYIDPANLLVSGENAAANTGWNVSQIDGCIVDLTSDGPSAEGVAAPSPCAAESQYQPVSGQYQPAPCDQGLGEQPPPEQPAPSVPAQVGCVPADVTTAIDQVLPTGVAIGIGSPMACASSPPAPVASGSAASTSAGAVGGPETSASIPAFPASPISPPLTEPAATQTQPGEISKPKTRRIVHPAETTAAEHVLAVAAVQPSLASNEVPPTRVVPAQERRPVSIRVPETRGSRTRVEALEAQKVGPASGSRSTFSGSAWLTAAVVLLLFGLASFASAIAGMPGTARPAPLRYLGVRMTGKGLSRHPLGGQTRAQRGIRYRD
jgi:hypothetical protein